MFLIQQILEKNLVENRAVLLQCTKYPSVRPSYEGSTILSQISTWSVWIFKTKLSFLSDKAILSLPLLPGKIAYQLGLE